MTARRNIHILAAVLLVSLMTAACDQAQPGATSPAGGPATAETTSPTVAPPSAPTESGPTVGGTLVWAVPSEPGTLDPHFTSGGSEEFISSLLGAALVAYSPTGEYVPWLAESWDISSDGLVYTFTLKEGVRFEDGTTLTAPMYAWTLDRARDPDLAGSAADLLGPVESVQALDDSTLQITLGSPYYAFLHNLTLVANLQPLSQAWVEGQGDDFARNPMGVGPYKLMEWATGEKLVLERNPDYDWGPDFAQPYYLEQIEFRFLPEYATIMAALQTGEVDYALVENKDSDGLRESGAFELLETVYNGAGPLLVVNNSLPPFDDLKVRQALNMAVNREALVTVVADGKAVPQYGPISSAVPGYDPSADELGAGLYPYDPEGARALLAEAGWADADGDGVLDKDGAPLAFTIKTASGWDQWIKMAEVLQQQFKDVGVDATLQQQEFSIHIDDVLGGNFQAGILSYDMGEVDFCVVLFHSDIVDLTKAGDPDLNQILDAIRATVDPAGRQQAVKDFQTYMVEHAYVVSTLAPKIFWAMSSEVAGYTWAPPGGLVSTGMYLDGAYFVSE